MEKVAVVGLGYVGLPLALLADKVGYCVVGVDTNEEKTRLINRGIAPFIDKRVSKNISKTRLRASTDYKILDDVDIVIVCVPTPVYKNKKPNLTPLINSCRQVARHLHRGQLVIIESTVNPGTCDEVVEPILVSGSGLVTGKDFYLAYCPERINPGDKNYDVSNVARVVGSNSVGGLKRAVNFYSSIIGAPIKPMKNIKEAEAVKIVENCFRDVNIAFVNEFAMSFSKLGIDIKNVIEGASTKPYSFMPHFPGCGVGGHCIAVDPYYLIEYARNHTGFNHELLSLARRINNEMPRFTVSTLVEVLKECVILPESASVAVLGLAYKAGVSDSRESPSYEIIKELKRKRMTIKIFDPYVKEGSTSASLEDALTDVQAVVIATAHKEFTKLDPRHLLNKGVKIVIDGRNCLDKERFLREGLVYRGIGR